MAHKITAVADKTKDWKVVSILNAAGEIVENISVNRTNKKGEVFPNFDAITVGASVEGQLWQSSTGKIYLFAPKETKKQTLDSGPAANTPATAELKNILQLQLIPQIDQTKAAIAEVKFLIQALGDRLEKVLSAEEPPFEEPTF